MVGGIVGLLAGCGTTPPPSVAALTVGAATGHSLPAGFVGLSLEASSLVHGDFADTDLATHLKKLGDRGLIRIGGNSADKTFWTSTGARPPAGSEGAITPAALRSVATALDGTGWQLVLAVNLKAKDPARAADEAAQARQIFGDRLLAIEIGNEPNYYYPTKKPYGSYYQDFDRYVAAVRAAVPGVGIAGSDAGHEHPAFVADFAQHEAADPAVTVLTDHHYPLSACGGRKSTVDDLLSAKSVDNEVAAANSVVQAAAVDHVPAVMDETNSVTCGGEKGVSDGFASALWSLDYGLLLASHGVTAAAFHGGIAGCAAYSPLCGKNGKLTEQPVFRGLETVAELGQGEFLSVTGGQPALRAYAVRAGGGLAVVLDNTGTAALPLTVKLDRRYGSARTTVLSATDQTASAQVDGDSLSTTVPARSALVVHLT
jgi:hypothetical protein